jgi:hypothetical protein
MEIERLIRYKNLFDLKLGNKQSNGDGLKENSVESGRNAETEQDHDQQLLVELLFLLFYLFLVVFSTGGGSFFVFHVYFIN